MSLVADIFVRLLTALYRVSLQACPNVFKRAHGTEMLDCFSRRLCDLQKSRGWLSALRFGWQSHLDVVRVAREMRRESRASAPRPLKKGKTMQDFRRDVHFASRILVRKPLLSLVIILTLALGIGVNSVIFSGVNAILFYRPPARNAEEMVYLFVHNRRTGSYSHSFSYPNYKDLLDQNSVFAGILISQMQRAALTIDGSTEIYYGEKVSDNYFEVLGLDAERGRVFRSQDSSETQPLVVLGHSLWRDRFGSDPRAVGRTILMDGQGFTIVGVMPEGFHGTEYGLEMDFWIPVSKGVQAVFSDIRAEVDCRDCENYDPLLARLRPGASLAQAGAELGVISRRLEQQYPQLQKDLEFHLSPALGPPIDPGAARIAGLSGWMVMALVGMVLLIACANVASLMLARADSRRREMGIRTALGAGRWRLVRQLLTESFLLAGIGGLLAVTVAWLGSDALWSSFVPYLEYNFGLDFSPDGRVLGFTVALSLLTGLLFGLAPALQTARVELIPSLKGAEGSPQRRFGRSGLRGVLVVGQVALSFVLLTVSGLFMAGLVNARNLSPGFRTEGLLFVSLDIRNQGRTPEAGRELYRQIRRGVEALPAVTSADWSQNLPLDDKGWGSRIWAEGIHQRREDTVAAERYSVGPAYFETMGVPLLQGRIFQETDRPDSPAVAIISLSAAERIWPNESPLGKRIRFGDDPDLPWHEVVGVVGDVKHQELWEPERPSVYTAFTQEYYSSSTLVAATAAGDPAGLIPAVRQAVLAIDPAIPLYDIKTSSQHLTRGLWLPRMGANLALLFGVLALALAAVGLHGVVSYAVSRRSREFGIRMAVGAGARDIIRLVARHSLGLLATGSLLGLLSAVAISQLLKGLLFGIETFPWLLLVVVAALLSAVTVLASFVPARRALCVDPTEALRLE